MISEPNSGERPGIAAAVIIAGGLVLLIRRRVQEGDLSWQFPAGKIEVGESASEAAVREVLEETGLTVHAVASLGERAHPNTGRSMFYIACNVVAGKAYAANEREVADVAWCDRAGLAARVPYPLHGPVQDHLDARLR